MKNLKAKGDMINVTLTAAVVAGQVLVIGSLIGVASIDGEIGDVVPFAVEGVFAIPKNDAAVIAQGDSVVWDTSVGETQANGFVSAAGDIIDCGIAWEGKGATSGETILVKINAGGASVDAA